MSNKKQSSIEFYRTELSALVSMKKSKFQTENEIFQQAKQMHKEEIVESHHEGYYSFSHSGEQYYNETFGGNNGR